MKHTTRQSESDRMKKILEAKPEGPRVKNPPDAIRTVRQPAVMAVPPRHPSTTIGE